MKVHREAASCSTCFWFLQEARTIYHQIKCVRIAGRQKLHQKELVVCVYLLGSDLTHYRLEQGYFVTSLILPHLTAFCSNKLLGKPEEQPEPCFC